MNQVVDKGKFAGKSSIEKGKKSLIKKKEKTQKQHNLFQKKVTTSDIEFQELVGIS